MFVDLLCCIEDEDCVVFIVSEDFVGFVDFVLSEIKFFFFSVDDFVKVEVDFFKVLLLIFLCFICIVMIVVVMFVGIYIGVVIVFVFEDEEVVVI